MVPQSHSKKQYVSKAYVFEGLSVRKETKIESPGRCIVWPIESRQRNAGEKAWRVVQIRLARPKLSLNI